MVDFYYSLIFENGGFKGSKPVPPSVAFKIETSHLICHSSK